MEATHLKPISDKDVRHFIYAMFAKSGIPPTTNQAAVKFNVSIAEIEAAYHRLADDHQIALAPGSSTILMAHPFSAIPTNHLVEVGGKKYWGNGVWDILGIAVILQSSAKGHTPCGCGVCDEGLDLQIEPGAPMKSDWIVHFIVPAVRFWERIEYTGATILPFSSKDHLTDWLDRNNMELGYQMPIQTCWKLAQKWYKGRLERDWQRLDHENAQSVFHHLGLQGEFWNLGGQNSKRYPKGRWDC